MPQLKQRLLQVGATILAISMLGGYVVFSQKSQQNGQIMPGSKTKQLPVGVSAPRETAPSPYVPSMNPTQLMMSSSKGGVFTVSAQQPQAGGAAIQTAPGVFWVLPATNHGATMMSGSKFATVLRPEALHLTILASNPPSHLMLPGSKSFVLPSSLNLSPNPSVATSNVPATR